MSFGKKIRRKTSFQNLLKLKNRVDIQGRTGNLIFFDIPLKKERKKSYQSDVYFLKDTTGDFMKKVPQLPVCTRDR